MAVDILCEASITPTVVPRVLMVDDEPLLLNVYTRSLQLDFDVTTANSGVEALEVMQESGPFAVIVTDHRMPVMDGTEFAAKAHEISPASICIMLTGTQVDRRSSDASHFFRVLRKPCPTAEIKAAVNDAHASFLASQNEVTVEITEPAAVTTLISPLQVPNCARPDNVTLP